jgi:ABC-type sugar transport system ATPase subunit
VRHLVSTFFDGSAEAAMATLLDESASKLAEADFERLKRLIDEAKNKGDRE